MAFQIILGKKWQKFLNLGKVIFCQGTSLGRSPKLCLIMKATRKGAAFYREWLLKGLRKPLANGKIIAFASSEVRQPSPQEHKRYISRPGETIISSCSKSEECLSLPCIRIRFSNEFKWPFRVKISAIARVGPRKSSVTTLQKELSCFRSSPSLVLWKFW